MGGVITRGSFHDSAINCLTKAETKVGVEKEEVLFHFGCEMHLFQFSLILLIRIFLMPPSAFPPNLQTHCI